MSLQPDIPESERRFLECMVSDPAGVYRAFALGRMYGRQEAMAAICALPSSYTERADGAVVIDGPKLHVVVADRIDG